MPPFVVAFVNVLLSITIRYFTKFEKYGTITDYNSAVAIKMTTAMFINTSIITFLVYRNDFYG